MVEEFDVAVIGSGPGGYVASIRSAQLGLKTACIEMQKELGGTCLNVGCIPSKSLLQSTEILWKIKRHSKDHGIEAQNISVNFDHMMSRKQKVVASFNQGISGLFKKNKITRFQGKGNLTGPNSIDIIDGEKKQSISAKSIILATGSEPISLPFLPFDEKQIVSSTGALNLEKIPKTLIVVGAGVIGVELGSVYNRLGSKVTFIEFLDRICPVMDESISKAFQKVLSAQGMEFHLSSKVTGAKKSGEEIQLQVSLPDQTTQEFRADVVLVSIGRKPYTQGLGLQKVGIELDSKGFIPIDGLFRTKIPNIYAIGDIVDGPMLAHKASEEGVAVAEIIAGHQPFVHYITIPNVVYTEPEVASVGLTEAEAKKMGRSVVTGQFPFKANSRARCTGEEEGLVKVIADEKTDVILGIHIMGAHASELIAEGVVAIQNHMKALELANTCHAHPTLSEAIKEAALAVHKRPIHL
jgi:dihydrolipoamide dehydrogenase